MRMTKMFQDHLNRTVRMLFPPRRIISLCPSVTETLFALGLHQEVIGRTRYCIHPADQVSHVAAVGGTKQVKEELIHQLQPDLIIAEKEENPKEMVEELAKHYPVYVTDVENLEDALNMIADVGVITGREKQAAAMMKEISSGFSELKPSDQALKVAYIIWNKPYMAVGNHTYIQSMLENCGFINVFKEYSGRYPTVTEEDLKRTAPDFILLSSEPFPFKEAHQLEFQEQFPLSRVILVDGEIFSWYGSRMLQAPSYFLELRKKMEQKLG
jgi:iron complex transport system substrate-binding protein